MNAMLTNLTARKDPFTIRDSPQSNPAAKRMRRSTLRRRHIDWRFASVRCACYLRAGSCHGSSQATTKQHADPQAAFARRQKAQATLVLPQVQHGGAAACGLPELWLLHGACDDRERRSGVEGGRAVSGEWSVVSGCESQLTTHNPPAIIPRSLTTPFALP